MRYFITRNNSEIKKQNNLIYNISSQLTKQEHKSFNTEFMKMKAEQT